MKKILFVVGSTRRNSFNGQLAKEADSILAGRAEVSFLDFADVPFINQDTEFPAPSSVVRVRDAVSAADGIWIFTPEYNQSYPGYLKNLLDWISRPLKPMDFSGGTTAQGKKATISGVSGKSAAAFSRTKLFQLLEYIGMRVCGGEGNGFSLDSQAFMSDTLSLSTVDLERLKRQADEFMAFV